MLAKGSSCPTGEPEKNINQEMTNKNFKLRSVQFQSKKKLSLSMHAIVFNQDYNLVAFLGKK